MQGIVNVILWAALIQGLFLAVLYIFSKQHKSFANFLLGMFLISIILEAFTTILPYDYIGSYAIGEYFSLPEVKLFIPLFFVHYILEKLGSASRYRWFLKINYLIAIAISAIVLINLYLFLFKDSSIVLEYDFFLVDKTHLVFQCYAFLMTICAFVISIKETLRYRNLVRNEFSDYQMLQINWLWQLIFMLLPAAILWGVEIVRILITGQGQFNFVLVIWGFVALFLYFLSYKAYRHQNLFDELPKSELERGPSGSDVHITKCNPKNSETIRQLMLEHQYYLNHDLTLYLLAKEINMSSRLISSCINQNFGCNFNEWINGFRVEKALELLKSDSQNRLSIEGIGAEAGFKSRSAMYAAFKKKLGHSPGHYRQ